jgi:hypothetical protein
MEESPFLAPSTGRGVRAVLFDVFGTVVDWRSGISAAVRAFADRESLQLGPFAFADRGGHATGRRCSGCARASGP